MAQATAAKPAAAAIKPATVAPSNVLYQFQHVDSAFVPSTNQWGWDIMLYGDYSTPPQLLSGQCSIGMQAFTDLLANIADGKITLDVLRGLKFNRHIGGSGASVAARVTRPVSQRAARPKVTGSSTVKSTPSS